MGIGSSGMQGEYRQKRRYPSSKYGSYGGKKQKRGSFFKKTGLRSTPQSVQPVIPMQPYSQYNSAFGPYPYMQRPIPAYGPVPQAYPGYMPMNYNNYSNVPNVYYPQQPPPPPPPPPPQIPVYQPNAIPQQVPVAQPMPMTRQVPYTTYSPYAYPSPSPPAYPTGTPYSTPYVQPQVAQPVYPTGGSFGSSSFTSSGPYRQTSGQLSTDWTGGGKISPGFLGPPI